jgi:hypothetical protein
MTSTSDGVQPFLKHVGFVIDDRVQAYFIGPGLICMSPLSKILNIRQYVDGLAIFLFPVMLFSGRPF